MTKREYKKYELTKKQRKEADKLGVPDKRYGNGCYETLRELFKDTGDVWEYLGDGMLISPCGKYTEKGCDCDVCVRLDRMAESGSV